VDQRERLRLVYRDFNRLPADERREFQQRFRDLSLDQRQRALEQLRDQMRDRRPAPALDRR